MEISLKSMTSAVLAEAFPIHRVYTYGLPLYLLTNNDSQPSKFFKSVCTMLGLKHYFTTAYNHQTNGQIDI